MVGLSAVNTYIIVFILLVSLTASYVVAASIVIHRQEGIWRLPFGASAVKSLCRAISSISVGDFLPKRFYTTVDEADSELSSSVDQAKTVSLRNKLGDNESIVVDSVIDIVPSTIQRFPAIGESKSPQRKTNDARSKQPALPIYFKTYAEMEEGTDAQYQRSTSQRGRSPFNIDSPHSNKRGVNSATAANHHHHHHHIHGGGGGGGGGTHHSTYNLSAEGLWRLKRGLLAAQQLINPRGTFWHRHSTKSSLLARSLEEAPKMGETGAYFTFSTSVS